MAQALVRCVQQRLQLEDSCLVIAVILLERLMLLVWEREGPIMTIKTWRSVLLTAILLACKLLYDEKVFLHDFQSALPELDLRHLGDTETTFLLSINFSANVSSSTFARYWGALMDAGQQREQQPRAEPDSAPVT